MVQQNGFNQLSLYWLDDKDQPVEWQEYYICSSCPFFDCVSTCATPADAKRLASPPACPIDYAAWAGVSSRDRDTVAYQVLDADMPITLTWYKRSIDQVVERKKFLEGINQPSGPAHSGQTIR